ncbi:MAG: hypothetical protein MJZ53_02210 [Paludibacteraceae bacterium]|nr:hypothetical protein [Paludibacteraceae bacterium]
MKNNFSKQWDAGGGSRSIIQGLNLFTSRNLFKSLKSILMIVALLSLSSNVWGAAPGTGYTKITSISSLAAGDEVILFCDDAGTGVTGYAGSDATVSTTSSDWTKFVVEKSESNYYFKDPTTKKYITKQTSNKFGISATTASENECTVNTDGVLCINSRYLCKNGDYYRMYTSIGSYKGVFVYKVPSAASVTSLYLWEAGVKSSNLNGDYKVGAKYTLPKETDAECGDKVLVGWSTVEIQTPGAKPTSNYYDKGAEVTLADDNTFYAVFADASSGGGEEIVETVGFESSEGYAATTTYNSSNYTTGSNGSKWTINYGAFATSGAIVGSQSAQFRIYSSGGGYGQLYNSVAYTKAISKVMFSAKAANTNGQVKVSYSTAGTSWTDIETKSLTATTTEYTVTVPVSGVKYIKFTSAGTRPSSSNYSIYVDAVKIYSSGGTSYSNYTTTCGPSTYTVLFSELLLRYFPAINVTV